MIDPRDAEMSAQMTSLAAPYEARVRELTARIAALEAELERDRADAKIYNAAQIVVEREILADLEARDRRLDDAADQIAALTTERNVALARVAALETELSNEKRRRAKAEWEGGWNIDPAHYVPKSALEAQDRLMQKFVEWDRYDGTDDERESALLPLIEEALQLLDGKVPADDPRDRLIAEIVAWFDVVEQKADEVIMDEWPTDWLERARAAAMQRGVNDGR